MFTIESHLLKATINPKGAELTSLQHKENGLDYLWNGDPAFWGKHSPVLFPIVGSLKDNTYFHEGNSYQLPRHGFARDLPFAVETSSFDSITFLLKDSDVTRKVFPFAFEFRIVYIMVEDSLGVTYQVINPGKEPLFFSVGAHPAFKLPLAPGTSYEDYYLQFNHTEQAGRWPLEGSGLITAAPVPFLETDRIPLAKSLFQQDAIVFKQLQSTQLSVCSAKTPHGITVDFPGFPFLGIWAAKDADFLCIEPWCGIADSVNADQQLVNKEGINKLEAGESFTRTWTVRVF